MCRIDDNSKKLAALSPKENVQSSSAPRPSSLLSSNNLFDKPYSHSLPSTSGNSEPSNSNPSVDRPSSATNEASSPTRRELPPLKSLPVSPTRSNAPFFPNKSQLETPSIVPSQPATTPVVVVAPSEPAASVIVSSSNSLSMPKTGLLDSSVIRSKGHLASSGSLANRRRQSKLNSVKFLVYFIF